MGERIQVGIIGGSGMNHVDFIENVIEVSGKYDGISDTISLGNYQSVRVAFLPRHGRNHELPPSKVPYQENILALKRIGCTHAIATTAVLSLNPGVKPGDFQVLSSFIDGTERRLRSYYSEIPSNGGNILPPSYMPSPFSDGLSRMIKAKADGLGIPCHAGDTVMTIEGPRFPSEEESRLNSELGADVLNFTTVPEVNLANEMSIPYEAIAMVTDYDSSVKTENNSVKDTTNIFHSNSEKMKRLLQNVIPEILSVDWAKEENEL